MKLFLTAVSVLAVFAHSMGADYTEKIAELRRKNVNQPIRPSAFQKLNGGFWNTWGKSNSSDCGEYLTPEAADARAKQLHESGYTGIVVSGRHWRIDRLRDNPQITRQLKLICDAAHKYGMIVISHFDLIQFSLEGMEFALQHPDWWQLDLHTFTPFTKFCVNSPGFRNFYIEYLRDLIRNTGVDGFMLDELAFAQEDKGVGTCACPECRKKFTAETGVEFPSEPNDPRFSDIPNPWYSLFSQWRVNCLGDFQYQISKTLQKEFPELFFVSYSTGFLEPGVLLCGWNYFTHFKYIDGVGLEPPQGSTIVQFPRLFTRCKLRIAVADALQKPLWVLGQTDETPENLLFMTGFYKAMRHTIWSPRNIPASQTNWKLWVDPASSRTVPGAALICSEQTINQFDKEGGDSYYQNREFEGWAGALTARKITYDVIMSEVMTTEQLAKYPVVILPNSAVLTVQEQKVLADYLLAGGVVLTSGRFGFDAKTGRSGLRPAIEVAMPEHDYFNSVRNLSDGMLVRAKFAASPAAEFRKVGKGYIGIYPAVFAIAESRIHFTMNKRNIGHWNSIFAHHDFSANSKLIDSWLKQAFALRPPAVQCDAPEYLVPEVLKDSNGNLIVAMLDISGRDDTEILKKSMLSGKFTLKVRGKTVRESFRIVSPAAEIAPPVEFERKDGWDHYTFPVDKMPVYSQIMVKYE